MLGRVTTYQLGIVRLASAWCLVVLLIACGARPSYSVSNSQAPGWQPKELIGVPAGPREAAYDKSCNCLWILTRSSVRADSVIVQLSRFNITDSSSVRSLSQVTGGAGAQLGGLSVDNAGHVWFAFNRTITEYDAAAGTTQSWPLPGFSASELHRSNDPSLDGTAQSLSVDSTGEVWVAAKSVSTLIGFNSNTRSWDRAVSLTLVTTGVSRVESAGDGRVTINGLATNRQFKLSVVDPRSNHSTELSPNVVDYWLVDSDHAIYVDESPIAGIITFGIGLIVLSSNQSKVLASKPPMAAAILGYDGASDVWFPMATNTAQGVAKLNLTSGVITTYQWPDTASTDQQAKLCPVNCDQSGRSYPGVAAIVADAQHNVWVIDDAGTNEALESSGPSPIYEMAAGS
jgi:streptogramin lyase